MGKIFNSVRKVMVVFCTIAFFGFILLFRWIAMIANKKYISHVTLSEVDAMDGYDFEKYISILLSTKGIRVKTTPPRGDYGADLVIRNGRTKIILQCKLYYKHGVGVSAVQQIHSAIPYYGASLGVVLTNSHFTTPAEILAKTNGVVLLDRNDLVTISKRDTTKKQVMKIICQNMS